MGKDEKGYGSIGSVNEEPGEWPEAVVAADLKTPLVSRSSSSSKSRSKPKNGVGCCASFFRCLCGPSVTPKELVLIKARLNEDLPGVIEQITVEVARLIRGDRPTISEDNLAAIKDKTRTALGGIPRTPITIILPEFLREYFGAHKRSDACRENFIHRVSRIINGEVRKKLVGGPEEGVSLIPLSAMEDSVVAWAELEGKEIKDRDQKAWSDKWKCCFNFTKRGLEEAREVREVREEVEYYHEKPSSSGP